MDQDEQTTPEFNPNSILDSVKKIIGISNDYTIFDHEIITAINSSFFTLWQLGVGPKDNPFHISDNSALWTDVVDDGKIDMYKSYIAMRTRLLFDPPTSGILMDSINNHIKEFEWRMTVGMDEYNSKEES